jgi:hypothetical protein
MQELSRKVMIMKAEILNMLFECTGFVAVGKMDTGPAGIFFCAVYKNGICSLGG